MESNLLGDRRESPLTDVFGGSDRGAVVYVVGPNATAVRDVVRSARAVATPPSVRLVGERRLLRRVFGDFGVASAAADLVDDGRLSLRTVADPPDTGLVATGDRVVALVHAAERTGSVRTDDDDLVADVWAACEDAWTSADSFSLRTPPMSRVRETLADDLGREVRADFAAAVAAAADAPGDAVDAVAASLLVAARHERLFYDVSRWGEDVGVASKATYSRVKNDLEDAGLVDTEKVPVEVGRPRQRLLLADRLADADPARLVREAAAALD